jgi:hypothetical protein
MIQFAIQGKYLMQAQFQIALMAVALTMAALLGLPLGPPAVAAEPDMHSDGVQYLSFAPPGAAGVLHYYVSRPQGAPEGPPPTQALIAIHGHPRDANKTFDAALSAASLAARLKDTLVVAPLFQVPSAEARKCQTKGVPKAEDGDLLWTCESWLEGGLASNDPGFGSFDALDAMATELVRQWPSLRTITIAGFSAGAQMVQHYIGFAADQPGVRRRYVVSDPGIWLYFDPDRPQPLRQGRPAHWSACNAADATTCEFSFAPGSPDCINVNQWKYGTDQLPAPLKRTAAQARQHYALADIMYVEGALDSGEGKGTFYPILDKSCAAEAQGPYRLQRGLAFAAYDRARLAPSQHRQVTLVPDCAHDVACVFPSDAARAALFGSP